MHPKWLGNGLQALFHFKFLCQMSSSPHGPIYLQVDVGHIDLETEDGKVDDIVKMIKTTGKLKVDEGKTFIFICFPFIN